MPFSPRKPLALLASLPLTLGLTACFGADVTINGEEGVPLSEIDQSAAAPVEVVLAGSDKVIISQGDAFAITVEGSEDAKAALRFVLDGDLLGISRDESLWDQSDQATIRVTLPAAPEELVITGSGSIETQSLAKTAQVSVLGSGEFTGGEATLDALDVNLAGSGSAALGTLTASSLEISIGGSGSVTASGTAERLDINLGGSGGARLDQLKANDVEVAIAGSGSVNVQSDGAVEASIMGSGSVNVEGSATCTESAMGSGSLNCPDGTKTSS
ncbi:DUF2807 domain-containing protein [Erythrobacter sp. SCSIO 43205]|uniref:head GIN domain-containing protein n=1 Tax=Erythrobacter sp. SCSIO 43205 TaxID=2779361 RepID=UPI001CA9FA2A|nr:head GIN domain-containing protein [Erythrobacter sp. SCSIO 43205]UAB78489.1 DUF2807 domain-containing protein [Erythrobacter sp. SCSIO 43205]